MKTKFDLLGFLTDYELKIRKVIAAYREKESAWRYGELSLTFFIIAFFAIFAIRPAVTTISGLVGEIKQKEEVALKMRKKINAVIAAQEEYASLQEKVELINSFLPSNFEVASGLAQVVGVSQDSNLSLSALGISKLDLINETRKGEKDKKNASQINFQITTEGDYQKLKKFLNDLVNVRRFIEVSQYQIVKFTRKGEGETGILSLSVNGIFHYWDEEKK